MYWLGLRYVIKIGSVKVSPAFVSFPAIRGSNEVHFHRFFEGLKKNNGSLIFSYSYLELLTF